MKKILSVLVAVIAIFATSCDTSNSNIVVEKAVLETFKQQFPNARRVHWENKGAYYEVDFRIDKEYKSAWYRKDAVWMMTETDIRFNDLPIEVQNAFYASTYSTWRIDDIDKFERPGIETIYIIEVEQNDVDVDLYYNASGLLIKTVTDNDHDNDDNMGHIVDNLPPSVMEYINTNYPSAIILDIDVDTDDNEIEVDILHNGIKYELKFSLSGVHIETEIDK